MWQELWDDFTTRAGRLSIDPIPIDAVDTTLLWQLEGHPIHVGRTIAPNELQLPELYSGSPWVEADRWIAFLTLNPNIDPAELSPTTAHFRDPTRSRFLVSWFEHRFLGQCENPLRHGRADNDRQGRPTWWQRSGGNLVPRRSSTWTKIDRVLRESCQRVGDTTVEAPLGQRGVVVDAVPWKFRHWSSACPELREELLCHSKLYLSWWLHCYQPSAIVTLGVGAWNALVRIDPRLHDSGDSPLLRHAYFTREDGTVIPVLRMPFPSRQEFNTVRAALVEQLAKWL